MTLVLSTERLIIKPIARDDSDALHSFWTDVDVRRYLWEGKLITRTQVDEIIASSDAMFAQVGLGLFALSLADKSETKVADAKAAESLVGFCGFRHDELADGEVSGQAELLYGILPQYWGLGLVSEATREVLRYGFVEKNLEQVVAATDTPNQRSVTVMQRLGMTFEQRREYHGLDTVFYSLQRSQFLS